MPLTTAVTKLRARVRGTVITPEDADFEVTRAVYNGMITTRPAVIVRVVSQEDVVTALAVAAEHELPLAVRSGGHSVTGASLVEDGLVIDMRRLNHVRVDPLQRTVTIGGGAVWGDVDAATTPHGLVTTGGRVSSTGVSGLTLGGGSGWLERKFGLVSDNLLSAEVVTADRSRLTASAVENPELFWGLHGGGGNFGVVTSLTLRLHPLPEFSAALLAWPADAGPSVLRAYRDVMESAPDELGGGAVFVGCPAVPGVPAQLHGRLSCIVLATYVGPADELAELVEPLSDLDPWGGQVGDTPYTQVQELLDDSPGYRHYWTGEYLTTVPDRAIERFCARADEMPRELKSQQLLVPWGGAVARRSTGAMANRDTPWLVHPLGQWTSPDDDERGRRWARNVVTDLGEWSSGATYLNFISDTTRKATDGFGEDNYRRLARLKARYDPDAVFRPSHHISPDPGASTSVAPTPSGPAGQD